MSKTTLRFLTDYTACSGKPMITMKTSFACEFVIVTKAQRICLFLGSVLVNDVSLA